MIWTEKEITLLKLSVDMGLPVKKIANMLSRTDSSVAGKLYTLRNPDKHKEASRTWRANNPVMHSVTNRKWRKDNPEIASHHSSLRRARKLRATPKWANLAIIKEFYRNRPEGYHVDHVVPLQGDKVCGLHTIENLQYLTASENLRKGNKFNQ